MTLQVERHCIRKGHRAFAAIDAASFASKNLYNKALYEVRQHFFKTGEVYFQSQLDKMLKSSPEYRALPAKVAQLVLMQLTDNWAAYFAAVAAYQLDPAKFRGLPRIPKYLDKQGRFVLQYNQQAINAKKSLKKQLVHPSGLPIVTKTKQAPGSVRQIRIVPMASEYVVEVIYVAEEKPKPELDATRRAGLDIGVDNLATVTFDRPGAIAFAISGRELKSMNQYYNKRKAELQSLLPNGRHTSRQIDRMGDRRYWRIQDVFHKASRLVVDRLVAAKVGVLIIGKNAEWKQEVNMGKVNNQTFCSIPHARFIDMLTRKAEAEGIQVICQEEAYTSKCSFLDLEPIEKHEIYAGKRIKRGLFRTADGTLINADCNGAYNHIRKFDPNAFSKPVVRTRKEIEGFVVHPIRFGVKALNAKKSNPKSGQSHLS